MPRRADFPQPQQPTHRLSRLAMSVARALSLSLVSLGAASVLVGCAGFGKGRTAAASEPTLASLDQRSVDVDTAQAVTSTTGQAMAAYRDFLQANPAQRSGPKWTPARAEALRRLGDLELEQADAALAEGQDPARQKELASAIQRYEQLLREHPKQDGNDRVLYQLARAQELAGQTDAALASLDKLVAQHPDSAAINEAQFRRGEVLFNAKRYPSAEAAYAAVLERGNEGLYGERAEYMLGWSRYKQGRLDEALAAFFGVLDRRADALKSPESEAALPRAERELLEDTFRVASLSLAQLDGAEGIAPRINTDTRRGYEYRLHEALADLYLKQERTKDAADTYSAFTRRHPFHAEAPRLQAKIISIYEANGFVTLALDAKRDHVTRYGAASEFRRVNPEGWAKAQPLVKQHLGELAKHHHALAQNALAQKEPNKDKARADVQQAIRWYSELITSYPKEPEAPATHFLLAELLFEDQRWAEAAKAYEQTAYDYAQHDKAAEAGYAALLALDKMGDAARPQRIDSALKFAKTFPADTRAGAVLANTAEALATSNDWARAHRVAQDVLALQPAASADQQRVAHTVMGHAALEQGRADEAEKAYAQALALTPNPSGANAAPQRQALADRLAAAIYKQGEAARANGQQAEALGHFARIAAAAPGSSVQATADFDAATTQIELKNWAGASQALEAFRQRHPNHPLQGEVAPKLALAYLEQNQPGDAALEFERVADTTRDANLARSARWQAAELHEKAGAIARALQAWERYAERHAEPLEAQLEARWRVARHWRAEGQATREQAVARVMVDSEARASTGRNERTRTLAGLATLALSEPQWQAYQQVRLVEPLQRNLAQKKARMQELLQAYGRASEGAGGEVATAATYRTAALYQDFSRALLASERPKRLTRTEREQYDLMLEEQAFPFEEQAIDLHEANARRATRGHFDEWVQKSFGALAQLKPVRWGKTERGGVSAGVGAGVGAGVNPSQTSGSAVAQLLPRLEQAAQAPTARAREWNQLGVAYRQAGRFADAAKAYDRALSAEPQHAPAVLNLAILNDLYLGEPSKALPLYERYVALVPAEGPQVGKWMAELRNRKGSAAASPTPQPQQLTRRDTP